MEKNGGEKAGDREFVCRAVGERVQHAAASTGPLAEPLDGPRTGPRRAKNSHCERSVQRRRACWGHQRVARPLASSDTLQWAYTRTAERYRYREQPELKSPPPARDSILGRTPPEKVDRRFLALQDEMPASVFLIGVIA